jgi:hypothetical protein
MLKNWQNVGSVPDNLFSQNQDSMFQIVKAARESAE